MLAGAASRVPLARFLGCADASKREETLEPTRDLLLNRRGDGGWTGSRHRDCRGRARGRDLLQVKEGGTLEAAVALVMAGQDDDLQPIRSLFKHAQRPREPAGVRGHQDVVEHDGLTIISCQQLSERKPSGKEDLFPFAAGRGVDRDRSACEFGA